MTAETRSRLRKAQAEAQARSRRFDAGELDASLGAFVRRLWYGADEAADALVQEFNQARPWEQKGAPPP